ncbi:S-adenosyl-L-methionine-dependent methyltransferase [Meredithblackwellia eburnea MCA 4105]
MVSILPSSILSSVTSLGESALDRGVLPDTIVRRAIRYLCQQRLDEIASQDIEQAVESKWRYIQELNQRKEIAIETDKANEQHYEVSTEFIKSCLGKRMKYSCCLYPTGKETLDEAEELMLESYCDKAKLENGMDVLDLGCGWGSLTLFLAEKYPKSRITSLSNSATQKLHIDTQAALRGLTNAAVFTGDVKEFDFNGTRKFDRVLSIEMFEHMKNYEELFRKISTWLKPNKEAKTGEALLFVHIFCHRDSPYHFEEDDGWMARNFFSGGTMPSFDLFTYFQRSLTLERSWWINGRHYGQTCEDWLKLQDGSKRSWIGSGREKELVSAVREKESLGDKERAEEGRKTFYRFRVFFMACAEFFALKKGEAWGVGHYLFRQRD